jgi:hypothetical protein
MYRLIPVVALIACASTLKAVEPTIVLNQQLTTFTGEGIIGDGVYFTSPGHAIHSITAGYFLDQSWTSSTVINPSDFTVTLYRTSNDQIIGSTTGDNASQLTILPQFAPYPWASEFYTTTITFNFEQPVIPRVGWDNYMRFSYTGSSPNVNFVNGATSLTTAEGWNISGGMQSLLTISAVPEPSTYGIITGMLALGVAAIRRRRKS